MFRSTPIRKEQRETYRIGDLELASRLSFYGHP
jgi:hypothetical protein